MKVHETSFFGEKVLAHETFIWHIWMDWSLIRINHHGINPHAEIRPYGLPEYLLSTFSENSFLCSVGIWSQCVRTIPADVISRTENTLLYTLLQGEPSHRGPWLSWLWFWLFHCLPDSAGADDSLVEWAEHLGTMGENMKIKLNQPRSTGRCFTLYRHPLAQIRFPPSFLRMLHLFDALWWRL